MAVDIKKYTKRMEIFAKGKSLAEAIFSGKKVPKALFEQRMEICRLCDKCKIDGVKRYCSMCGCSVAPVSWEILNLAAYEERPPKWGCKHPLRKQGKGWIR